MLNACLAVLHNSINQSARCRAAQETRGMWCCPDYLSPHAHIVGTSGSAPELSSYCQPYPGKGMWTGMYLLSPVKKNIANSVTARIWMVHNLKLFCKVDKF